MNLINLMILTKLMELIIKLDRFQRLEHLYTQYKTLQILTTSLPYFTLKYFDGFIFHAVALTETSPIALADQLEGRIFLQTGRNSAVPIVRSCRHPPG